MRSTWSLPDTWTAWSPGATARSSMYRSPTPSPRRNASIRKARWCARRGASTSASAMPEAAVPVASGGIALAEEFWARSLALYGHREIAVACLRLQDEHGLDVNILLLCCFLARSGRGRLNTADLAAAEARVAPWRAAVIVPLRAARRALKRFAEPGLASSPNGLYAEPERAELAAEREEQRLL